MRKMVLVLLVAFSSLCFAGDGIADRVIVRDAGDGTANWYADASSAGAFGDGAADSSGSFGLMSDVHLLGDVNGDGTADRVIVRANPGGWLDWYADYSTATGFGDGNVDDYQPFGGSAFIPHAVVDMNGDGIADRVVVDNSPGYNNYMADVTTATGFGDGNPEFSGGFGGAAMTPMCMGDINGDGIADRVIAFDATPSWASDIAAGPGFGDGNPEQWALFGGPGFPAFLGDATGNGYADRAVGILDGGAYTWAIDLALPGGGMGEGNADIFSTAPFGIAGDVLLYGDVLVPEPATITLVSLAGLAVWRRRK